MQIDRAAMALWFLIGFYMLDMRSYIDGVELTVRTSQ